VEYLLFSFATAAGRGERGGREGREGEGGEGRTSLMMDGGRKERCMDRETYLMRYQGISK